MTSHSDASFLPPDLTRIQAREAARRRSAAPFEEEAVAGVPVAVTTLDGAVDWIQDWTVERRGGIDVRLVNAYSIVAMHADRDYLDLAQRSGVSLPDGTPVAAVLRLLRRRREAGRVRGPSFFVAALERGAGTGVREYFLGTTEETLVQIERAAEDRWPGVEIAGTWAPPFQDSMDDAYVEACRRRIEAAGADRVWIALGTPKQDRLAERLAAVVPVPCIGVGAAFDFLAGTKREAPQLLQRLGAEWLYRLATEPRRLWRRYLVGNVQFLWLVGRHGR